MTFAVQWHRRAIRELADIYLAARIVGRGPAVTAAADQIDHLLAADPGGCGESRNHGLRFVYIAPLTVDFKVNSRRRLVVVRTVRYHERCNR